MGEVVGSAEFELRATRDQLKRDIEAAEKDLKDFGNRAEKDASEVAKRVEENFSGTARGLAIGISALTAAFTAGLAFAVQFGRATLQMADNIADSARKIGIGTTALQEFQYVARRTGGEAEAVSGALDTFADKLASAAAGLSRSDLRLFQALGLDQEALRGFRDTEAALEDVIDRIGALTNEADRAAIAEKLGLEPLAAALREGSGEVERLRAEAQALGFVLDAELVAKGAAAQEQLESLSEVIGIQMAGAFIGLSDEVIAFTGWLSGALDMLNRFTEGFERFERKGQALTQANTLRLQGAGQMFGSAFTGNWSGVKEGWGRMTGANDAYWAVQGGSGFSEMDDPALVNQQIAGLPPAPAPRRPRRSDHSPTFSPPSRPERVARQDNSAQREAEREARRAERAEQEIFRARQRLLDVAEGDLLTAQQRYDLAQEQLALDREARDAEIASKTQRGELKKTEAQQLKLANQQADALEDRTLADNAFREIEDERLANERLLADLSADLVSLQIGAARTAKERQRLELDLLEITQRQRREALRTELDRDPNLTAGQRADAMGRLDQVEAAERRAVERDNQSPLQRWRDESLRSADEVEEAYGRIAANGLDALNDGLVDAIMNTRSLGEVFAQVASQIIADLLRISIRRSIVEPLANMLFPGAGGGSQNMLSSLLGGPSRGIPGFASGVSNFSGGLAYVHQGEVLANLAPGTDVIPAHKVGGLGGRPMNFDLRGAVMTKDLLRQMERMAMQSGGAAFNAARATIPTEQARKRRFGFGGG